MPELPEVETTCRALRLNILHQTITKINVYEPNLRWPVPENLANLLLGKQFLDISRRAKYLLLKTDIGTLLIHLGLTGKLLVLPSKTPLHFHERIRVNFATQKSLCYIDQRKFGAFLWVEAEFYPLAAPTGFKSVMEDGILNNYALNHPLLKNIGPEPLVAAFNATYLYKRAASHKIPVKQFLLDSKNVAGVGNIYASEALFGAKINPFKAASSLTFADCENLVIAIQKVLEAAIFKGGTTIRDFASGADERGYFQTELKVYGRTGKPCYACKTPIVEIRLGQRSTFYCPCCQPDVTIVSHQ